MLVRRPVHIEFSSSVAAAMPLNARHIAAGRIRDECSRPENFYDTLSVVAEESRVVASSLFRNSCMPRI
jgi:hypothetical protein